MVPLPDGRAVLVRLDDESLRRISALVEQTKTPAFQFLVGRELTYEDVLLRLIQDALKTAKF